MIRTTFLFALAIQLSVVVLAGCALWALIFHPEAIGATVARIIIGFRQAFGAGA